MQTQNTIENKAAMKYHIHKYKVKNLTPDERNAQRKNQRGIWLHTGIITEDRMAGLHEARETCRGEKFRAVQVY